MHANVGDRLIVEGDPDTSANSSAAPPGMRESVRTRHQHQHQHDNRAELTRILASNRYPSLPDHVQARIEEALAAEAAGRPLAGSRHGQPARSHASAANGTSGRQTASRGS